MEPNELYQLLIESLHGNINNTNKHSLDTAYSFASSAHKDQVRYSGEPYITHPLNVAILLADMELPLETVILGLLHDCMEKGSLANPTDIVQTFGKTVYHKLQRMEEFNITPKLLTEIADNEDEDIIYVKLADRLHNMKTLQYLDLNRWREKARETIEFFSPLAEKMHFKELKLELDQLSYQYLQ